MYKVNESTLSRVYNHLIENDIVMMTAQRHANVECVAPFEGEAGDVLKKRSNKLRNRDLSAALMTLGYGVTAIEGNYGEAFQTPQAVEVVEESFLVVNLEADPAFKKNTLTLGRFYCQDSIFFSEKGSDRGFLIGTNNVDDPGDDESIDVGTFQGGQVGEFLSRVGGRSFVFTKEDLKESLRPLSRNGRWAASVIGTEVLDVCGIRKTPPPQS